MRLARDFRPLARLALRQGWTIELTRKLHLRFIAPSGHVGIGPGTPFDYGSVKNFRAQLRRKGLRVP